MDANVFDEPVRVLIGLGFQSEIESVGQAYTFLTDWPARQRGPAHRIALDSCKSALAGEVDPDIARSAFAEFARRSGILAPRVDDAVAAHALEGFRSGIHA